MTPFRVQGEAQRSSFAHDSRKTGTANGKNCTGTATSASTTDGGSYYSSCSSTTEDGRFPSCGSHTHTRIRQKQEHSLSPTSPSADPVASRCSAEALDPSLAQSNTTPTNSIGPAPISDSTSHRTSCTDTIATSISSPSASSTPRSVTSSTFPSSPHTTTSANTTSRPPSTFFSLEPSDLIAGSSENGSSWNCNWTLHPQPRCEWADDKRRRRSQPISICCLLESAHAVTSDPGACSDSYPSPSGCQASVISTTTPPAHFDNQDAVTPPFDKRQPLAITGSALSTSGQPSNSLTTSISAPNLLKKAAGPTSSPSPSASQPSSSRASSPAKKAHTTMPPTSSSTAPASLRNTPSNLYSPNAIPPRTSSTGNTTQAQDASRPVLRPVPESDWLSRSQRGRSQGQQRPGHAPVPNSQATNKSFGQQDLSTSYAEQDSSKTSFTVTMQLPPPPDPQRFATQEINITRKKPWPEEKERVVSGPYDYLIAQPGKDFRSQLISAFNAWLDVPADSLAVITNVVAMLHTASLLIDDVEDSSSLRRGLPVAHNIFGVPQTINSANYIYFCALQELQKLRNPRVINIFSEELVNLHRGQGMDLYWRDTLTCPTEDDYLEMVGNKTGGLFRLGIKLMQAESRSLMDCVPLVNLFGLAFQIRDDYMNLSSREYSDNKGMFEDLTEGKFSFPVIHSIRSDPANLQLINILGQKTSDLEVKRYAVSFMERNGSFEYTREVLEVLVERARKLVDELDDGQGKAGAVHAILDRIRV